MMSFVDNDFEFEIQEYYRDDNGEYRIIENN